MPEPTPASLRIAVLMDSDNVSPKFAPPVSYTHLTLPTNREV